MAKKTYSDYPIPELDFNADWARNARDGKPQSGGQVTTFLNNSLRGVARAVFFDPVTYTLLFFKSDADKQRYIDDPAGSTSLVLYRETLSFTGTVRRVNIINNTGRTQISVSTNMTEVPVSFNYQLVEKAITEAQWHVLEDSATVIVYADNGAGYREIARYLNVEHSDPAIEINIRPYLTEGNNKIKVTAIANDSEGTTGDLVYNVTLAEMYVENFEGRSYWYRAIVEGMSPSLYQFGGFKVVGTLSKTLHFDVYAAGNRAVKLLQLEKVIGNSEYVSYPFSYDYTAGLRLDTLQTGSYVAKVYLTSGELSTEDNAIEYPFMYVQYADRLTAQVVTIANVAETVYNGESNILCQFAAYNAGQSYASPIRSVQQYRGQSAYGDPFVFSGSVNTDEPYQLECSILIEDESTEPGYLRTAISVTLGSSACSAANIVDNSASYPAVSGYDFAMNPSLRSNGEAHPEYVINTVGNHICTDAVWTHMAFVDGIDGWTEDDEGRTCLRIPAGSKLSLPFSFFKFLNNSNQGRNTFEICYRIDNVSDFDENCITVAMNPTSEGFTGIRVRPNNVLAHSSTDTSAANDANRGTNLREGQTVDLMISIEPSFSVGKNLVTGYIDGCKNFQFEFTGSWNFNANLEIGSTTADIYVYALRHYANSLRHDSAERNFVSTIKSRTEKIAQHNRIDSVIDSSHDISLQKVKENGYNYFIVEMKNGASIPSKKDGWDKSSLGQSTLEMHFGGHPSWDFRVEDVETGGQGTTSMNYWLWNLRFRLDKWPDGIPVPAAYQDSEGKYNKKRPVAYRNAAGEWAAPADSKTLWFDGGNVSAEKQHPALKRITAKINFASSMQSHKMGATYAYTLLHERIDNGALMNEAQVAAQQAGTPVPTVAVYEYPAFGFSKIGDTYTFIGLFTIGPDKGDKPTFGYDNAAFENSLITLEGLDHTPRLALFNHPWNSDVEYRASNESVNIVAGITEQDLEGAWEVSNAGAFSTDKEADQSAINDMLEDEFKPAYDSVYGNSTLIFPVALADPTWGGANAAAVLANINADIQSQSGTFWASHYVDGQGNTVRFPNSAMEFWIEGEYILYHYSPKTRQFVAGANLVTQCGAPTGDTLDAKNEYFKTFRRNAFKSVAANYWDLDDSIFCMCFLLMFGATDNFAKNSYPYKFKSLASGGRWRWRQDDLDTIFDIDNNGGQTKPYWIEYADTSANGEIYFAGSASVFWNLLFECYFEDYTVGGTTKKGIRSFGAAILTTMQAITSQARVFEGAMEFVKRYFWDKAQNYFPVSGYNEDAGIKYEDAWINQDSPTVPPLTQSLGSHLLAEQRWATFRMIYLMSLFRVGPFAQYTDASLGAISFRPVSLPALTVKPGIWLYPTVLVGQGGNLGTSRVEAGQTKTFTGISGDGQTVYIIQAADYITDLGDLCKLILGSMDAGVLNVGAARLKKIKIGDETAGNVTTNITTLNFTNAPALEEIDARNTGLANVLNLTNCPRIKKVYAENTSISSVQLKEGAKIETLHLPAGISELILKQTKFLSDLVVASWSNIVTLGLIDSDGVSATDALTNAFNADNSPLANISLKWNNIASVENDFVTALANIALGKTKSGAAQSYDASIQGTFKLDEPHYQADFDTLQFQEVTPSSMEGYKEAVTTIFKNVPLRAFYLDKSFIRFADAEIARILIASPLTNPDGDSGITTEEARIATSIPSFSGNTLIRTFNELPLFTGLTSIPQSCFEGSSIQSIDLSRIISLGNFAFNNCTQLSCDIVMNSLTTLPSNSINQRNRGCFYNTKIRSFSARFCTNLGGNTNSEQFIETGGSFYQCGELTDVYLPMIETLSAASFRDCSKLVSIDASNITTINNKVFWGCGKLTSISLSKVKTIGGWNTFAGCSSLAGTLNLPELLTITDYYVNQKNNGAFFNCILIEKIIAPKCTKLGGNTYTQFVTGLFEGCRSLISIALRDIETIHNMTFANCSNLELIIIDNVIPPTIGSGIIDNSLRAHFYVPDSAVDTYKAASGWTSYASRIHGMSELPEE